MRKFLFTIAALALLAVGTVAGVMAWTMPESTPQAPAETPAVKVVMPIDLTGKWESVESKSGTKMIAEIKNNTVFVEMVVADGFTGLWYGTFDILPPGQNVMVSSAIQDEEHFVLSSAETKEFLYQRGSLVFDFTVMGSRTTVELKRV